MSAIELSCFVAGEARGGDEQLGVRNPFNREVAGSVRLAGESERESAISAALGFAGKISRFDRHQILERARVALEGRQEEFARLMTSESGLCIRETRYEVGRTLDVLRFSAIEALRDDGQSFAGDVSPQGKARRIFTTREPLRLALAITPFNHPLNQVAHKVCPAIAAGAPLILKPSEKTPLTALRFAELLYAAGLPGPMLSVLLGPTDRIAAPLVADARVETVAFTGSVPVGKSISKTAGYKRLVLELGGNDPFIVLRDADLKEAARLAAEGSFRNSGQRCTAVKRILVDRAIHDAFIDELARVAAEYVSGDPGAETTRVGCVIDEAAAKSLERVANDAVARGAKIVLGGKRDGALLQPTVIRDVPRDAEIIVCESFGPLAPVIAFDSVEDAIQLANGTAYGLSAGVATNNLEMALRFVRELRCGSVNINEVPGYRVENSPFGGIKDSGLGIKEGVIESIKNFSYTKTFSLPW